MPDSNRNTPSSGSGHHGEFDPDWKWGNQIHGDVRSHGYGRQPDGDFLERKSKGEVFRTTDNLTADETFTSAWFSTDGFVEIELFVSSDVPSAVDGVDFQFTDDIDNPSVDSDEFYSYTTRDSNVGHRVFKVGTELDGFRVQYTNGDTATTDFELVATLDVLPTGSAANYVSQTTNSQDAVTVRTDAQADGLKIGTPSSLFGDLETISRVNVIDLASSFGTSVIRDEVTTTGSAGFVANPNTSTGEIQIETGTTTGSDMRIATAEYGRYTPGYSAQAGIGVRLPSLPTDGEARWGYFDDNNGFYFGYDGDVGELFVARRRNGAESERIYRSNWNGLDPDNVLDREWDPTQGDIYQIDFSWYGYGIIVFSLISQTEDNTPEAPFQRDVRLHAITVTGETSTSDPNEPIAVEVDNEDSTENVQLYFGGRQFSVFGSPPVEQRVTGETRFGVSIADGSWTHVMSWRRGDPMNDANSKLNIDGIDVGITQTAKFALVINANVTGTTYNLPSLTPDDETLLEVSTAGTFNGIGNGTKVWEGSTRVSGTGQAQTNVSPNVDVRLGQDNTLSLIAQANGGTGSLTSTVRMLEDW